MKHSSQDPTAEADSNTRTHTELWRVFCAIEIPEPGRKVVLHHIQRVKEAVPDANAAWSREANLHLTLKFLGEITQVAVVDLSKAAARAVSGLASFSIRLEQTGSFPKQGQPRVLWIGIKDSSGELGELQRRLEEECSQAGFKKESRPFHPHLTVARLRRPQDARRLAGAHRQLEFEPADIAVAELLVMRSRLSSEGSKYSVISRHQLAPS